MASPKTAETNLSQRTPRGFMVRPAQETLNVLGLAVSKDMALGSTKVAFDGPLGGVHEVAGEG